MTQVELSESTHAVNLNCRITRADHPEFREVSEQMLADKRSMCEEYLKLLEPGMTLMRGE